MSRALAGFLTTKLGQFLRIGAVVPVTEAEGPGQRFAVWGQGCSIRCSGCFNPHLWASTGGSEVDPHELAEQAVASQVEGVTLLGGEPFDQASAFATFARAVREAGLSVMTFTGHDLEDLAGSNAPEGAESLLAVTDLLVDGPYIADQMDLARPWVGSRNQRFHFLTDRYKHLAMHIADLADRVEVRVGADGTLKVNGWASVAMMDDLLAGEVPTIGRGQVR